ncbi:hypothetical protein LTR36_006167 [Oleoguttula mirabilis]|uniref:Peptidase S9 prolyl oligopeptidase catalytic domain-containing protein n=1 Tax=Oleoguttula mirabilis TaxID=1507867 RepID=A0AAV9JC49_9PEZI|nr:hypothetical protein LTR36_006167 [Oleoguttula mirabilis]
MILVPPSIFVGLLLALWAYKCLMTVLFQDKIIYMPYMPPFARKEKIADYATVCWPVEWEEQRIRSLDGTRISLCVGGIPRIEDFQAVRKHVVICYFQGNGSSPPPRLPLLSQVLKLIHTRAHTDVRYTLVALAYRGYWTSTGRATQSGIELDAQAMLKWIAETYTSPNTETQIIIWGQSIGAGVASTAAATFLSHQHDVPLAGLVLETPFTSVKSMLLALYPQKWLPYQYLYPFLWNHWDSESALRKIAEAGNKPRLLLMPATRDEVVPPTEIAKLEHLCKELKLEYERKNVVGALHTEAATRREGQEAVAKFILSATRA